MLKINYLSRIFRKHFYDGIKDITDNSLTDLFCINEAALIVIDMQEYFLNSKSNAYIPASTEITDNVNKLINHFKRSKRPVIITKHIDFNVPGNMMIKWWNGIISKNDPLAAISSIIDTESCNIIVKSQYDVFHNNTAENFLTDNNVTQVLICGVHAHICCDTSARSAFVRGYQPFIVFDATASYNHKLHTASLICLSHCCSVIISTKQVTNA